MHDVYFHFCCTVCVLSHVARCDRITDYLYTDLKVNHSDFWEMVTAGATLSLPYEINLSVTLGTSRSIMVIYLDSHRIQKFRY